MENKKLKNYKFKIAMVIAAVFVYGMYCWIFMDRSFSYVLLARFSGWFLLAESCLFVIQYKRSGRKVISPFMVFYALFLLFSAGQLIVIALYGTDSEFLYIWKRDYGDMVYKGAVIFTTLSVLFFQAGYFLSVKIKILLGGKRFRIRIRTDTKLMLIVVYMISFSAAVFILMLYRRNASSYSNIYQQNYGRYYNLLYGISLFVIPAYLLIQYAHKEGVKRIVNILTGILIVLNLTIGRRGSAMMYMVPAAYTVMKKLRTRKIKPQCAAAMLLGGYCLVNLMYTVAVVRETGFEIPYFLNQYIINLIQLRSPQYLMIEMGSSIRNIIECMYYSETGRIGHKYGMTYLYSVFILLPGILRRRFDSYAVFNGLTNLPGYITKLSGASYGLGGSVQYEAYYNFSFAGVLLFVLFGYVTGKALEKKHFANAEYDYYFRVCLLAFLLTFPRTCMQDNLKRILYVCMIPFYLYDWAVRHRKDSIDGGM